MTWQAAQPHQEVEAVLDGDGVLREHRDPVLGQHVVARERRDGQVFDGAGLDALVLRRVGVGTLQLPGDPVPGRILLEAALGYQLAHLRPAGRPSEHQVEDFPGALEEPPVEGEAPRRVRLHVGEKHGRTHGLQVPRRPALCVELLDLGRPEQVQALGELDEAVKRVAQVGAVEVGEVALRGIEPPLPGNRVVTAVHLGDPRDLLVPEKEVPEIRVQPDPVGLRLVDGTLWHLAERGEQRFLAPGAEGHHLQALDEREPGRLVIVEAQAPDRRVAPDGERVHLLFGGNLQRAGSHEEIRGCRASRHVHAPIGLELIRPSRPTDRIWMGLPSPSSLYSRSSTKLAAEREKWRTSCWHCRNGQTLSRITQAVSVADGAAIIDAGTVTFELSAFLGGFANQNDFADFGVTFLDGANVQVGSASLTGPSAAGRGGQTGLLNVRWPRPCRWARAAWCSRCSPPGPPASTTMATPTTCPSWLPTRA